MKLVCPSCGAVHGADAWVSDGIARQCLLIVGELPWEVSRRCLSYLALFRPLAGRGLQWARTLRLLNELRLLVEDTHIQWEKKPARPNSASAWGQAMERMIEHPPKRLPLKSHGYLRAIAYEIADEMDRQNEARRIRAERTGSLSAREYTGSLPERLTLEEMKKIAGKNYRRRRLKKLEAEG